MLFFVITFVITIPQIENKIILYAYALILLTSKRPKYLYKVNRKVCNINIDITETALEYLFSDSLDINSENISICVKDNRPFVIVQLINIPSLISLLIYKISLKYFISCFFVFPYLFWLTGTYVPSLRTNPEEVRLLT